MFPLLTYPLALLGLIAVPALLAVYLLHNRFKKRPVASLMLWVDRRQFSMGGSRLQRARVPWLFFLEMLILVLLVIAAADPRWWSARGAGPIVVVLDNSVSMRAVEPGGTTARERGLASLKRRLDQLKASDIRVVVAGADVRELSADAARQVRQGRAVDGWDCREPEADLEGTLSFLGQTGGGGGRALVVSDRLLEAPPRAGVRWLAVGIPAANAAIVSARRSEGETESRVLLRVANYDTRERRVSVFVGFAANEGDSERVERRAPTLKAGEIRNLVFDAPGQAAVRAWLGDDALAEDNRVTLLPRQRRPVRVDLSVQDATLRRLVEKALNSTGSARINRLVGRPGDLLITDRALTGASRGNRWALRIVRPQGARGLLGPFVGDRSHPLLEGLNFQGILWGASTNVALSGLPLLSAGNTQLIAVDHREGEGTEVTLQIDPAESNVQSSPHWPSLFWNLLAWRASEFPGMEQVNVAVGSTAILRTDSTWKTIQLERPDGRSTELAGDRSMVTFRPDISGVYQLKAGEREFFCSAHYEAPAESDLRQAATGENGSDLTTQTVERAYVSSAVWFLVAACLGLAAHHAVLRRGGGGR